MPLLEVVGKVGAVAPAQILTLVPNANVGVTTGFTVTLMVTGFAHSDELGVNV
jgi:ribosomal protein L6P/L9E